MEDTVQKIGGFVSVRLDVEIAADGDTRRPTLVAEERDGDWCEITSAELRRRIDRARADLAAAEKLAAYAEAVENLRAFLAEHDIVVDEWDTSTLDESLRDSFAGFFQDQDGRRRLVLPAGQDPVERLRVAVELLHRAGGAR
ncbi:hypothetical protein [Streptomyces sp. DH37]|uniref:hypothetical protein n=1 Tax=Streptomyces sp. DH37 TaxID=3040122 RepID=UPI0024420018|nr:hypothetical protein [Streptomyces sp. DH37]MDG9706274.1 hypothetical protein [Streptomyces sp. DH37]